MNPARRWIRSQRGGSRSLCSSPRTGIPSPSSRTTCSKRNALRTRQDFSTSIPPKGAAPDTWWSLAIRNNSSTTPERNTPATTFGVNSASRSSSVKLVMRLRIMLCLLALSGCSGLGDTIPKPPPGGLHIKGAGATFPSVLYNQWFAIYQSQHPKTTITYDAVGSGEGVQRFIGKDVKEDKL